MNGYHPKPLKGLWIVVSMKIMNDYMASKYINVYQKDKSKVPFRGFRGAAGRKKSRVNPSSCG